MFSRANQPLAYLRPVFVEHQRFHQRWLWALVICVSVLLIGAALFLMLKMRSFEMTLVAIVMAGIVALMLGFYASAALITRVDADGVHVRFWPFRTYTIPHHRIVSAEAVTYEPIGEFGGWGIKGPPGRWGWCYTISGNRGVRIELDNRYRLLVGSNRPEELASAINAARA